MSSPETDLRSGAAVAVTEVVTVLGFDYGTKKMGIAAGQTITRTATGLETIPLKKSIPDWIRIDKLVQEWNPGRLILGLPLNRDGSEHKFTKKVQNFAKQLHQRYGLEVLFVDERLSSWEAKSKLKESGRIRDKQSSNVDTLAAQLILQNWLDEQQ